MSEILNTIDGSELENTDLSDIDRIDSSLKVDTDDTGSSNENESTDNSTDTDLSNVDKLDNNLAVDTDEKSSGSSNTNNSTDNTDKDTTLENTDLSNVDKNDNKAEESSEASSGKDSLGKDDSSDNSSNNSTDNTDKDTLPSNPNLPSVDEELEDSDLSVDFGDYVLAGNSFIIDGDDKEYIYSSSDYKTKNISFNSALEEQINFGVIAKLLPSKGNLVYEYNPFRNYRLTQTMYYYKNRLFTPCELLDELNIKAENVTTNEEALNWIKNNYGNTWQNIPKDQDDPVLMEAGELADFETDELKCDLNHPVDILPLYSYDGSVNLILNDGSNLPKLINSRFSATERNQYLIVDRKGDNDTNIYDLGSQFDIDTSLYKRVIEIPKLKFYGVNYGGLLSVGNYHFYFKYADADGNETDFVCESGLVSVFIGGDPGSCRTGFRDENSHKNVLFLLSNIDSAYLYVTVYYTKATSDILENATVTAKKIELKFLVNNNFKCNIVITGYENTTDIPLTEINPYYLVADSIETLASCLNMLFIGHIHKPDIPYKELTDLSLRFFPLLSNVDYEVQIDQDYNISSTVKGYYDSNYIYNLTGYWNHEIYRLGIVYILSDNTLSPVFNIRGTENVTNNTEYSKIPMYLQDGKTRNYIMTEEDTYKIISDVDSYKNCEKNDFRSSSHQFENSKGVILLNWNNSNKSSAQLVFGIKIETTDEVLDYIKNTLNIKGFFFVRLKRIPTIYCLAYTIGIDKESKTPLIPSGKDEFVSESFLDNSKILTHDFDSRLYKFNNTNSVRNEGAICPEYDVNYPYYNSLFTGESFIIQESDFLPSLNYLTQDERNFYMSGNSFDPPSNSNLYATKIIGLEDNTKLVSINESLYSARAGEAEEAYRFEYFEKENKITDATNLVRGSYGPYLGTKGYIYSGKLIDIKIPGYAESNLESYFKIRYNDKSSFYAISERIPCKSYDDYFETTDDKTELNNILYRGDCYICQFTHRLNRNFLDPSAPTNDKIVDPDCWADNYEVNDQVVNKEKFEDINLGDVNAIKLGMWITITIRSTKNLNIRSIDDSIPDETAITGHDRGFYPYQPMSPDGAYKVPEALCHNSGFEKSVSERYNFEVQDVPAIKNDFTNRIAYSDVHVTDAFKNGFRVFLGTHYRDYPKTYGSITKLVELRGNLLCICEHGVLLINVNERAVAGQGTGGYVYINTSNVLPENPKVLSDVFGSLWKESIIKTPKAVYGVDTIGKKIWRTDGTAMEIISDFKVLEFLNNNISLTERELTPIIGIRNVKAHYNRFKDDVMFTFYDNLYGFNEKVWNLCYNERLAKWITFYSWIPSYSENIYNLYFSFDRNTSKWIAKLGVSHHGNNFSDGITLEDNVITGNNWKSKLYLDNRTLPTGDGIEIKKTYSLKRDNYGNYKNFVIVNEGDPISNSTLRKIPTIDSSIDTDLGNVDLIDSDKVDTNDKESGNNTIQKYDAPYLIFTGEYDDICAEIYETDDSTGKIKTNERGCKIRLNEQKNSDKIVILLNVRVNIQISYDTDTPLSLVEAYGKSNTNRIYVDSGYYDSVIAVIPKSNLQFLTTDFWKHGLAGIIDIADEIAPTYWYGKQHPFEFEFVVAENPQIHKIFDNLLIISNNASPESFHYEIVGDCYDFANDKKNMYIRQEATKELYAYNGSDIVYNDDYSECKDTPIEIENNNTYYAKSTIFPLYYARQDKINDVEDSYHLYGELNNYGNNDKNFSALAGAEIVRYKNLNEYRIWNHAKAVDIRDFKKGGRIRGNMHYKEDRWDVQINPINLVLKNEKQEDWTNYYGNKQKKLVPSECNLFSPPKDLYDEDGNIKTINLPDDWERNIVLWNISDKNNKEVKLKDKFIKIRIRYSGEDLAIINAIKTLYSASYA